jgi:hypothetical protein
MSEQPDSMQDKVYSQVNNLFGEHVRVQFVFKSDECLLPGFQGNGRCGFEYTQGKTTKGELIGYLESLLETLKK